VSEESTTNTAAVVAARRRAGLIGGLRKLAEGPSGRPMAPGAGGPARDGETCDLCGTSVAHDHRHLLQLDERRIDCVCETCWAVRAGEEAYRPVGTRVAWLPELFMRSSVAGGVVGLYPSPAGATESQLDLASWEALVADNPVLAGLEPDVEGLIVNRLADPRQYAIAPIDECYALVGLVKSRWEGISGGVGLERAIAGFFDSLCEKDAV
jgi:hypothetical protein